MIAAALALTAALGASPAVAAPMPAGSSVAVAALDWLEGELAADGGHLTTSYAFGPDVYSYDDWGLTFDAALALAAGGRGAGTAATTALAQAGDHIADYVTGAAFGAPDDRYAAALAKSVLAVDALGGDPSAFGGMDLVAELSARMQPSGADAGRFTDASAYGDYSNGLGQALAVMGLARTPGGVPAAALDFLLDQQCPGGGFRGDYTVSGGCTSDADATVDATAFALQALTAALPTCTTREAATEAVAWLLASQAGTGGFGGESGANTNSTGLAGQALRVAGSTNAADAAAAFVASMQLPSGDDAGAIALNQAGYDSAADGIAVLERDSFRRATGQAVLALDLPAYSEIGTVPVDPASLVPCAAPTPPAAPTGMPTVTASASTVELGGTLTITGTGFAPAEQVTVTLFSTPVLLATAAADANGRVTQAVTIPRDLEVGIHHLELVGLTSGSRVRVDIEVLGATVQSASALPATGRSEGPLAAVGTGLVLAGAALVVLGHRRGAGFA